MQSNVRIARHPLPAKVYTLDKMLRSIIVFILSFSTALLVQAQSPGGIIFRDDFNRSTLGNAWVAADSWSVQNNAAYNSIDGTGGTLRTAQNFSQSSFIIETAAKGFTVNYYREFRITFGQSSLLYDNLYTVSYTPYSGGQLTLARATDNIYYPQEILDEVIISPALSVSQWYTFKIARYTSGLIQVYLNQGSGYGALPILETIDSAYPTLGHAGWQVDTQTFAEDFFVDYIDIRVPTVEKPAIREKPVPDDMITQVSAASGKTYTVAKLSAGVKQFTDRPYTITSVPAYLQGASFIQTANDDKTNKSTEFLNAYIKKNAVAFIGYDPRATKLPAWLAGWTKTGDRIGITDPGSSYLEVYSKVISGYDIYPYPLTLGGNLESPAAGSLMNYLVAVIETPPVVNYEAENAQVSGANVASNHPGYSGSGFVDYAHTNNDYIEWTVNTIYPGSYALVFRYTNGSTAIRPLEIKVNGVFKEKRDFYPTGSWQSWVSGTGTAVYLPAGTNKIRTTTIGIHGPNIDYVTVVPTESLPSLASARVGVAVVPQPEFTDTYLSVGNSPNPFREQTTINYTLVQKAPTRLAVYDMAGRQIAVLVDGIQEAGSHSVAFQAAQLKNGLYLYRLQSGAIKRSGRMLLNR